MGTSMASGQSGFFPGERLEVSIFQPTTLSGDKRSENDFLNFLN